MANLRKVLKEARRQGWRVVESKHFKWYSPDGVTLIIVSKSASDGRAEANSVADFKKAGVTA